MPEPTSEILTPEQVAEYLQVNRETVYRYIRDGKLIASRLGRTYRVPKRSVELLLWTMRTRQDVTLREYTGAELASFLAGDQLDADSSLATMIASESALAKDWNTPEEDEAWADL